MDIRATLTKYKSLGEYFSPDYEQDNEVLTEFKRNNPSLSDQQSSELVDLLLESKEVKNQYFVADLLYLYDFFNLELFNALITTAINHQDPSFNRIFVRPCIMTYGIQVVVNKLTITFDQAESVERNGINRLTYWLRPQENGEVDKLKGLIASWTKNNVC